MSITTLPGSPATTHPALQLAEETAPVRVLHVLPALVSGGMEWATVRLIRAFARRRGQDTRTDATAHGICVLQDGDDQLLAECRALAPTWVLDDQPRGAKTGRRWMCRPLREVIGVFGPDVVHARSTGIWFDAAAAMLGRNSPRLLLSFHGHTELSPLRWRRRMINRWATRRADAVLAVSREAARMMHREWGVPEHKLYTVPNGVDIRRFHPVDGAEPLRRVRDELDLAPGCHVVVCVANLLPIKAINVLLEAWRKVSMVDPNARLLLAGDGPLREELTLLAQRLRCGRTVRFLGSRPDVPALLQAADLFVLPSRYEGSSNAALEAMATAVPVVAFDVGGMRELIEPNRTGWLVPADQPHRFAETIVAALLDAPGRRRVGQAARKTIAEHYTTERWVDRYASVYHQIADCRLRIAD